MPIIVPVSEQGAPLNQGDILRGVCLFSTQNTWNATGGSHYQVQHTRCLVVSRPCVCLHKDRVTVVAIEPYKSNELPESETYDEVIQFYTELRDGLTTPDLFYLGQFDGEPGTFCARFDSFHTISIPSKDAASMQAFLQKCRVARLHREFVHDLHLRLTRAFASLGFDDFSWFSTPDLGVLIHAIEKHLNARKSELSALQHKFELQDAQQSFAKPQIKEQQEKEIKNLREKVAMIEEELAPYKAELANRQAAAAGTAAPAAPA